MPKYQRFVTYWVINALLIYFIQVFFPSHYTFGNSIIEPYQAVVISSFVWTFLQWNVKPFFKSLDFDFRCNSAMAVKCLLINFAIVWMLARYSILSGIGISSSLFVLILAFAGNFVQYYVWLRFRNKK